MTLDMNVKQLVAEIERAQADEDASVGVSINRHVEDGLARWEVQLGVNHTMTTFDSVTDYRGTAPSEVAAAIIQDWDAAWDS